LLPAALRGRWCTVRALRNFVGWADAGSPTAWARGLFCWASYLSPTLYCDRAVDVLGFSRGKDWTPRPTWSVTARFVDDAPVFPSFLREIGQYLWPDLVGSPHGQGRLARNL
jgi:hypothetical protein